MESAGNERKLLDSNCMTLLAVLELFARSCFEQPPTLLAMLSCTNYTDTLQLAPLFKGALSLQFAVFRL